MFIFALAPTIKGLQDASMAFAEPLARYLTTALDAPVNLIRPETYAEAIDGLAKGSIQAAMLGDHAAQQALERGVAEPLALTVSSQNTGSTYRSVLATRSDSGIHSLQMVKGRTLGLVDGQSTSGWVMPRAMLREAGIDPDSDVTVKLLDSHLQVVEALLAGDLEVGAFHEHWLTPPQSADALPYAHLRVLAQSREIPRGPVVVGTGVEGPLKDRLLEAMISIHDADPPAARVLLAEGNRFTATARRSQPTLKSIAALAGVSYATVSRVVNHSENVNAETRRRVEAIIKEVGYAPNGNARVLLGAEFPMVGWIAPWGAFDPDEDARHAMATCASLGIPLVFCPSTGELQDSVAIELVRDRRLGGVIVSAAYANDPALLTLVSSGSLVFGFGAAGDIDGVVKVTNETLGAVVTNSFGNATPG